MRNILVHFLCIVSVIVGALFLKINTYIFVITYNTLILVLCILFLKKDFDINVIGQCKYIFRSFLRAFTYALTFSITVVLFFGVIIGTEIAILPRHSTPTTLVVFVEFLLIQIVVALSEEGLFRFYLHELIIYKLNSKVAAAVLISICFALLHYISNGIWKQTVLSFFMSMLLFVVKENSKNDDYLTCSLTHLIYNIFARYLFSI